MTAVFCKTNSSNVVVNMYYNFLAFFGRVVVATANKESVQVKARPNT